MLLKILCIIGLYFAGMVVIGIPMIMLCGDVMKRKFGYKILDYDYSIIFQYTYSPRWTRYGTASCAVMFVLGWPITIPIFLKRTYQWVGWMSKID